MRDLKQQILNTITKLPNGCWEWNLVPTSIGYGLIRVGHRHKQLAHKVSYEVFKGPIPEGLNVLHTCDKRNYVNPEHLKLGTQKENIRDSMNKGRHSSVLQSRPYTCKCSLGIGPFCPEFNPLTTKICRIEPERRMKS